MKNVVKENNCCYTKYTSKLLPINCKQVYKYECKSNQKKNICLVRYQKYSTASCIWYLTVLNIFGRSDTFYH